MSRRALLKLGAVGVVAVALHAAVRLVVARSERWAEDHVAVVPSGGTGVGSDGDSFGSTDEVFEGADAVDVERFARRAVRAVVNASLLASLLLMLDLIGRTGGPAVPEPVDLTLSPVTETTAVAGEVVIPILIDLGRGRVTMGQIASPVEPRSLAVSVETRRSECGTVMALFGRAGSSCLERAVTIRERAGRTVVRLPAVRSEGGAPVARGRIAIAMPDGVRVGFSSIPLVDGRGEWDASDRSPLVVFESSELIGRSAQIAAVEAVLIGFALNFVAGGVGDIVRGRRRARSGYALKAGWISTLALLAASLIPGVIGRLLADRDVQWRAIGWLSLELVPLAALLALLAAQRVVRSDAGRARLGFVEVTATRGLVVMVLISLVPAVVTGGAGSQEPWSYALSGLSTAVALLAAIMTQDWLSRYFTTTWATVYAIIASVGLSAWSVFSFYSAESFGYVDGYRWVATAAIVLPSTVALVAHAVRPNASRAIAFGLAVALLAGSVT